MLTAGQKMTKNKKVIVRDEKKSSLRKWIYMGGELFGSLLFPRRCILCDEILSPEEMKNGIHKVCESKIYPVREPVCLCCGRPIRTDYDAANKRAAYLNIYNSYEYCYECKSFAKSAINSMNKRKYNEMKICQGKALYLYQGDIKQTMYRFKYSNKREYAKFFAQQAVQKYGAWIGQNKIQAIVPVPMYLPKERVRGYLLHSFANAYTHKIHMAYPLFYQFLCNCLRSASRRIKIIYDQNVSILYYTFSILKSIFEIIFSFCRI